MACGFDITNDNYYESEKHPMNKLLFLCEILQPITYMIGILSILFTLLCWNQIPDVIPAHYGLSGMIDSYASKNRLFVLFLIILFLLILEWLSTKHLKEEATSTFAREKEKHQMEWEYPLTVYLGFLSQCCFAYIVFCSATSRNLGCLFLLLTLIAAFAPIPFLFIKNYTRK